MSDNPRVQTLIDSYKMMRNLSERYIAKVQGLDYKKRYQIDGIKFNSAYWIVAHLVWTEHFLIIEGVGGDSMGIQWLNDFAFGTNPDEVTSGPSYEEILTRRAEVHQKALEVLSKLTDDELKEDNNIEANFGGSMSKETVIMHAIRHEPMHIGQLSWILKLNGIKSA
jgi:uncharacterized damage-inducible protein DinB